MTTATKNPVKTLRSALEDLLDGAGFEFSKGETRALIRRCQKALAATMPSVAHTPAVGIFRYDPGQSAFVPAREVDAKDRDGNLKPGYEYLFRQPPELTPH